MKIRFALAALPLLPALLLSGCGADSTDQEATAVVEEAPLPEGSSAIAGRYFYLADAAMFTGCHTGQRWPVAQGTLAAELQSRFLALGSTEPVIATVFAHVEERAGMEEGSTVSQLVVDRITDMPAEVPCSFPLSALTARAWKVESLNGQPLALADKQKAPTIQFNEDGSSQGFSGCNRFSGNYNAQDTQLTFAPQATTRMACKQGGDIENTFLEVMGKTTHFDISGLANDRLELRAGLNTLATLVPE